MVAFFLEDRLSSVGNTDWHQGDMIFFASLNEYTSPVCIAVNDALPDSLYQIPNMRSLSHPCRVVITSMLVLSCSVFGEGSFLGIGPACSEAVKA